MALHVLQITDCHLVAAGEKLLEIDTQATLEAVLEHSTATRQPDAIIASGDLCHSATAPIYQRFLETVKRYSDAPLVCLPGNHDVLAQMQAAALPMRPLELGDWSVLWLDSHVDDVVESSVTDDDRAYIRDCLGRAAGKHILLATHHPMMEVACPWLDKDGIQQAGDLLDWIRTQADSCRCSLRAVVFGHAHQEAAGMHKGIPLLCTPSTCFQFGPKTAHFSVVNTPPGYRWLSLYDDGSLSSAVFRVEGLAINPVLPPRA